MNTTAAKNLVRRLVSQSRDCARDSRTYPRSRDYFCGLSRGFMDAARQLAHEAYGQNDMSARGRAMMADYMAKIRTAQKAA